MMAFLDLAAELAGTLPGLSPALAESYTTRAWFDICRARLWSFLLTQGVVVCPAQITTGTVSITNNSTSITFNAAATTALTGLTNPVITLRQIRFGSGGTLYNITAAAGSPLVATLDRAVLESTSASSTYQLYRAYVPVPAADFLRWEAFDDPVNQYTIAGPRLTRTRRDFDLRDPARSSQGLAQELGSFLGTPLYELWPHPTDGQTFLAAYLSKGTTPDYTSATSAQPAIIPDSLIVHRALAWYGYPWAQSNKGGHPKYQRTDLLTLLLESKRSYERELAEVKKLDDEQQLSTVYNRGWRGHTRQELSGLIGDARWWQSHPVVW